MAKEAKYFALIKRDDETLLNEEVPYNTACTFMGFLDIDPGGYSAYGTTWEREVNGRIVYITKTHPEYADTAV